MANCNSLFGYILVIGHDFSLGALFSLVVLRHFGCIRDSSASLQSTVMTHGLEFKPFNSFRDYSRSYRHFNEYSFIDINALLRLKSPISLLCAQLSVSSFSFLSLLRLPQSFMSFFGLEFLLFLFFFLFVFLCIDSCRIGVRRVNHPCDSCKMLSFALKKYVEKYSEGCMLAALHIKFCRRWAEDVKCLRWSS